MRVKFTWFKKKTKSLKIESKTGAYLAKNVVVAIGRMDKPKKPDYRLPRKLGKKINFDLSKTSSDEKILVMSEAETQLLSMHAL